MCDSVAKVQLPLEIWNLITDDYDTVFLEALRTTCRELRDACDSVLARHIVVTPQSKRYDEFDGNFSPEMFLSHFRFTAPNGSKLIAGLGLVRAPFTQLPEALRRLFTFTEVLTLGDPVGNSEFFGLDEGGLKWQHIATSMSVLASAFPNLRKLRLWDCDENLYKPFTAMPLPSITSFACRAILQADRSQEEPWFRLNAHIPPTASTVVLSVTVSGESVDDGISDTLVARYPASVKEVILFIICREGYCHYWDNMEWTQHAENVFLNGIKDASRSDITYHSIATPGASENERSWPPHDPDKCIETLSRLQGYFPNMLVVGEKEFAAHGFELLRSDHCDQDFVTNWKGRTYDYEIGIRQWSTTFYRRLHRAVERLETDFMSYASPFSCGGVIPLIDTSFTIHTHDRQFTDARELMALCSPAPIGMNGETVYNESYRLAREMRAPLFSLSADLLEQGSVLQSIKDELGITRKLYATMTKINVYPIDGYFRPHVDTPQGDGHVGTITLCLPTEFAGGDLAVRHGGRVVGHSWRESKWPWGGQPSATWAFLFSDCEHEVWPVTEGIRVAIAYDVFAEPATTRLAPSRVGSFPEAPTQLVTSLKRALNSSCILPYGGILAFGLQHNYALTTKEGDEKRFEGELKGLDAVWATALACVGLKFEVVASYSPDETTECHKEPPFYKDRGFTACRDFNALAEERCEFYDVETSFSQGKKLLGKGEAVVWVTEQWTAEDSIWVIGNDAGAPEKVYVGAALWAYVGPPERRSESTSPDLADAVLYYCSL